MKTTNLKINQINVSIEKRIKMAQWQYDQVQKYVFLFCFFPSLFRNTQICFFTQPNYFPLSPLPSFPPPPSPSPPQPFKYWNHYLVYCYSLFGLLHCCSVFYA